MDDGKCNSPYRLIFNEKTYFNLFFFCIFKTRCQNSHKPTAINFSPQTTISFDYEYYHVLNIMLILLFILKQEIYVTM